MIKKLLLIVSALTVIPVLLLNAQCVPDPTITTPGIYPDSATGLASGTVGIPYSEVIQARVPVDTLFLGQTVLITSIDVDNVTGLPPGITYSCTPASCSFPGGSNGCMLLSGTPTTSGVYPLDVTLTANGTLLGFPVPPQTTVLTYYSITIDVNNGISATMAPGYFDFSALQPNPAQEFTEVIFATPLPMEVRVTIYNVIGKEVYSIPVSAKSGYNTTRIATGSLTAGIYLVAIDNGSTVLTKKLIVTGK